MSPMRFGDYRRRHVREVEAVVIARRNRETETNSINNGARVFGGGGAFFLEGRRLLAVKKRTYTLKLGDALLAWLNFYHLSAFHLAVFCSQSSRSSRRRAVKLFPPAICWNERSFFPVVYRSAFVLWISAPLMPHLADVLPPKFEAKQKRLVAVPELCLCTGGEEEALLLRKSHWRTALEPLPSFADTRVETNRDPTGAKESRNSTTCYLAMVLPPSPLPPSSCYRQ